MQCPGPGTPVTEAVDLIKHPRPQIMIIDRRNMQRYYIEGHSLLRGGPSANTGKGPVSQVAPYPLMTDYRKASDLGEKGPWFRETLGSLNF